jgi:hypothetical protein
MEMSQSCPIPFQLCAKAFNPAFGLDQARQKQPAKQGALFLIR